MQTMGIILFAHGSRDPLWSGPINAIAQAVSVASPHCTVRCAYLELMPPTLEAVVTQMALQGILHIRVAPMFLGVGKHAREDLPEIANNLQIAYPNIRFELMPSIGEHPELIAAIASILTKSL